MSTETISKVDAKVMSLPYAKHFVDQGGSLATSKAALNIFKPGEKSIYTIAKIALIGGAAFAFLWYALPVMMVIIGRIIGVVVSCAILVAAILFYPVFIKAIRVVVRKAYEKVIESDPFYVFKEQRMRLAEEQKKFNGAVAKIKKSLLDLRRHGASAEETAKKADAKIIYLRKKFNKNTEVFTNLKEKPKKTEEEAARYTELYAELLSSKAEISRWMQTSEHQKTLVRRYGMGAKSMQKLSNKMLIVGVNMGIKTADLQQTEDMLKIEWEYAANAKQATSIAESVLGFEEIGDVKYAMNYVTNCIAMDLEQTSNSLTNIDRLLEGEVTMDDEEFSMNLDAFVDSLETIEGAVPDSSAYLNPDHVATEKDTLEGFGGDF